MGFSIISSEPSGLETEVRIRTTGPEQLQTYFLRRSLSLSMVMTLLPVRSSTRA